MLAIFKTGGKQYSVKAGQILKVEKLEGSKGESISFNKILSVSDSTNHAFGTPVLEGATIEAKILDQIRDKKIIVFKKRQRQNYRHTQGHRQYLTVLQIESITYLDKKSSAITKTVINEKNTKENENKVKKIETKENATPKKKVAVKKKKAVKKKEAVKKKKKKMKKKKKKLKKKKILPQKKR